MGNPGSELRRLHELLVDVKLVEVAGDAAKCHDVCFGHRSPGRIVDFAHGHVFEIQVIVDPTAFNFRCRMSLSQLSPNGAF